MASRENMDSFFSFSSAVPLSGSSPTRVVRMRPAATRKMAPATRSSWRVGIMRTATAARPEPTKPPMTPADAMGPSRRLPWVTVKRPPANAQNCGTSTAPMSPVSTYSVMAVLAPAGSARTPSTERAATTSEPERARFGPQRLAMAAAMAPVGSVKTAMRT